MGYAIFSLVTAVLSLLVAAIVWKGNMKLVSGSRAVSEKQNKSSDKMTSKSHVVRILIAVAVLQLTTGIVCFFQISAAILITELSILIATCLLGVVLHALFEKTENPIYIRIHKICTVIVLLLSPVLLCGIAFCVI